MTLELHATAQDVMCGVRLLQEFARTHGVPEKSIFGLALALEECGSNVVNHVLQRDAQKTFKVDLECIGDTFAIELRDTGPEFDPTSAAERKPQADDDGLPGGWGIQLVRRYVDRIEYKREGGQNILRLTKQLGSAANQDNPHQP